MEASDYQRVRLWTGIASITMNSALIWAAWFATARLNALDWPFPAVAAAVVIALVALSGPLDMLAGCALERGLGHTAQPREAWLVDWLRMAFVHALGVWVAVLVFGFIAELNPVLRAAGVAGLVIAGAFGFALLPGMIPRSWIVAGDPEFSAKLRGELAVLGFDFPKIRWLDHGESSPVDGNWLGAPKATLFLSSTIPHRLSPREAALMVARECESARRRYPQLAAAAGLAWLALGALAAVVPDQPNPLAAGFFGAAVMTSFCLASLFFLPAVSRSWNRQLDQFLKHIAHPGEAVSLLEKIQVLNRTDTDLSALKTDVFHPIPPLEDRLKVLK